MARSRAGRWVVAATNRSPTQETMPAPTFLTTPVAESSPETSWITKPSRELASNDQWQFSFNPGELSSCHAGRRPRWSWRVLRNQPLRKWRGSVPAFSRAWFNSHLSHPFGNGTNSFDSDLKLFTSCNLFSRHQLGSQPANRPPRNHHQWLWHYTSHCSARAAIGQPLGLFRQLCVHT